MARKNGIQNVKSLSEGFHGRKEGILKVADSELVIVAAIDHDGGRVFLQARDLRVPYSWRQILAAQPRVKQVAFRRRVVHCASRSHQLRPDQKLQLPEQNGRPLPFGSGLE